MEAATAVAGEESKQPDPHLLSTRDRNNNNKTQSDGQPLVNSNSKLNGHLDKASLAGRESDCSRSGPPQSWTSFNNSTVPLKQQTQHSQSNTSIQDANRPRSRISAPAFEAPPSPPESETDGYPFPPSLALHEQTLERIQSEQPTDLQVHVQASSPDKQPPAAPQVRRSEALLSPPLMTDPQARKRHSEEPAGDAAATTPNAAQDSIAPNAIAAPSKSPSLPVQPTHPTNTSQPLKRSATAHSRNSNQGPSSSSHAAPAAAPTLLRAPSKLPEDRPLVGNLIGEDHVNYVLMYNMLTGIRIGVSRCQAKMQKPLTDEDYDAQHKFSFDMIGNELTPSARYDFKFKDYAPWVFRDLREHFLLDPADYLVSLTAKYILSELGSPGKSGSFFYFSRDYRFIIKTIHRSEHKFLRKILRQYHDHVKSNPHTLISRFYGLHRVKLPRGRKIHFVIMNNLMPPHRDVHETYDLKGSTVSREYPEDKAALNPRATLKDLNWLHRGKVLELGPDKRALLFEQLKNDTAFLQKLGIMDYSLLLGIHDMGRGNKDKIREGALTVFDPNDGQQLRRRRTVGPKRDKSQEAQALREALERSDPKAISEGRLPDKDKSERQYFIFYQDEGGLQATDNDNQPLPVIYYLGLIDILTPYGFKKGLETFFKGFVHDRHAISPVPPIEYGNRFLNFMSKIVQRPGASSEEKKTQ